MSGEALRPGEIELEETPAAAAATDTTTTDTETTETETEASTSETETGTTDTTEATPPAKKHTGAVGELIQLRKENKQLRERQQQIDSNPVMQRLTPEIQQAIVEGRVHIAPPQASREAEQERLTGVAEELGLVTTDGKPDIAAAKRVDAVIRKTVQQAIEPVRQGVLAKDAQSNYDVAMKAAEEQGYDMDVFREVYNELAQQPNGSELLAQRKICEVAWERAVGKSTMRGKSGTGKKGAAKPGERTDPPAAVIVEDTGRRPSQQTTQLSPALQRVYRDSGVDPSKSFTSKHKIDLSGPIDLE